MKINIGDIFKGQFIVSNKYDGLIEIQMDHKRGTGNSL
jgi:hypothetical protein